MFCPTAVDAYFGKKLSHLDLTFSKTSSYQERVSFEERVKEAEDTRSRYPNKIPLVIEKHKADKYLQDIDKVATIRPVQLYFLGFSHDRPTLLTCLCVSDQVAGAARDDPAAAGRGDQAEDPVSPPPADLPHRAEQVRYSTVQYSTVQYSGQRDGCTLAVAM